MRRDNSLAIADLRSTTSATIDAFAVPYTLQLCEAIERFTAAAAAQDPAGWHYDGADLRYAVERQLYFELINDPLLYECFARGASAGSDGRAGRLSRSARLLAPYLLGRRSAAARPPVLSRVRSAIASAMQRSRSAAAPVMRSEGIAAGARPVLFLVIQPKFVEFLSPVAAAAGLPYAFLAVHDARLPGYLAERSLPRIAAEVPPKARARANLASAMADFPELALTYDAMLAAIERFQPRLIVLPEGNAPIYEVANRAGRARGVPVLCIQQGWSPIVHSGFRNMTYTRMCVWGEGFAELLRSYNPGQHFAVTGNHLVRLRPPADALKRQGIGFFLQKGSRLISDEGWRACLELIRWSARQFPESEMRVREHPSTPLSAEERRSIAGFPNVTIMAPATHKLDDVLVGCRVAVSVFSTTLLEAAAAGTVPLILNITGMPHYHPDIAGAGAAIEVTDFDAARTGLTRLMRDERAPAAFATALEICQRRFFARDRDAALTATAAEVTALAG